MALLRSQAGGRRAANPWNGAAQPCVSLRKSPARPHEQRDAASVVVHLATLRSGLSPRRSRVRVPSLPLKYLQICILCCPTRRRTRPRHTPCAPRGWESDENGVSAPRDAARSSRFCSSRERPPTRPATTQESGRSRREHHSSPSSRLHSTGWPLDFESLLRAGRAGSKVISPDWR